MSVRSSTTKKYLALQLGAAVLVGAGALATGPATAAVPAQPIGDLFICAHHSTRAVALAWSTTVCPRGTRKYVVPIRTGLPGPAGPVGATGPAGSAGSAGPAGPTGPTGSPGSAGAAGATGSQGPVGPAGPMGPLGPGGLPGATGPAGAGGTTGATGPAGPAGATGPAGPVGPAGLPGPAGVPGAAGATGPAGATGATGPSVAASRFVQSASVTLAAGGASTSGTVTCPVGQVAIGGGYCGRPGVRRHRDWVLP